MKSFIGISGSIMVEQGGRFPGYERAYVNLDYVQAVALAGGVPFILPIIGDEKLVSLQMDLIDGLVLSGGHDVNPFMYGEEPSSKLEEILPKRDRYEQQLIQLALEKGIPILAICRGMQLLNVTCGGTLYQDMSLIDNVFIKHDQYSNPSLPTHSIHIKEGTRLFQLCGKEIIVNSFHHQAVKQIAPNFQAVAFSKDGVIEAIEKEGDVFVIGVQWHAEMMAQENETMSHLFKTFIEESKSRKKR